MAAAAAATPSSGSSVSGVYMWVIEDVINNVRGDFESENVDASVLSELQALWELKVMQSGAVPGWNIETSSNAKSGTVPATPVQDLNIPYEATEEYEAPANEVPFSHMRPVTSAGEPVMYQYMPPGPADQTMYPESSFSSDGKIGKPAPYMQQPAPWMTKKLPGVDVNIAYQEGQDDEDSGVGQAPTTKDFFTLATGKRKREELAPPYFPGSYIPQQDGANDRPSFNGSPLVSSVVQKWENLKASESKQSTKRVPAASIADTFVVEREIPQLDGVDDNYDDDVAEEDYNEPGEEEPLATSQTAAKALKSEDAESDSSEPPLNEDDDEDDLDDFDQGDDEPKTSDLALAQFEKVTRSKNKWKCILKDGIMNLNQKDILFVKGNGEFEF